MRKTKIKKIVAGAAIAALTATTLATSFAASDIGDVNVTGTGAFNGDVTWDDTFPGTATGTIAGIKVKAKVLPTLNMTISAAEIDLGTLTAGVEATGSLGLEIGTNAANGVNITARSSNGGLANTADGSLKINDTTTDGIAESYKFQSTATAVGNIDSTVTGYTNTAGNLSSIEVNNNTTEHTIYTTNKPEQTDNANADVTFEVATTSNAQTAAGDYEDTITFTVTGNF